MLGLSAVQADWISSYRQYEAALEAGDNSAANQHARDAWRLSAEALPPSENRALLAQNYAELLIMTAPEEAIAPLEDAVMMAKLGFGTTNYSTETLNYLLLGIKSLSTNKKRRLSQLTYEAWQEVPQDELWETSVLLVQVSMMVRHLSLGEEEKVVDIASRLGTDSQKFDQLVFENKKTIVVLWIRALTALQPKEYETRYFSKQSAREAQIETGRERLWSEYRESLVDAAIVGTDAANDQPYFDSVAEIPKDEAELHAWLFLARTFFDTYGGESDDWYSRVGPLGGFLKKPDQCSGIEIPWVERSIDYEPTGLKAWNGAVQVAYDISDTRQIKNIRLITEIPSERFTETVLEAMPNWRVGDISAVPPACRTDLLITINFEITLRG